MPNTAYKLVEYRGNIHLMLFGQVQVIINVLFYGLQPWHFSLFTIYLLCILQKLEK